MSMNGKRPKSSPAHQVFKDLGNLGLLGLTKPVSTAAWGWTTYSMVMAETLV